MSQLNDQGLSQPQEIKAKDKRTRRKKHEMEGRDFTCDCMKSYLSQAALNNHKKTKHPELFDNNGEKRKRGRPKINGVTTQPNFDARYDNFFNNPLRCKVDIGSGNGMDIEFIATRVFEQIYIENGTKCYSHHANVNEHFLLNSLITKNPISIGNIDNSNAEADPNVNANVNTNGNANGTGNGTEKKKNCDEMLYEYLVWAKEKTNASYMKLLTTFTVLFREFFNMHLFKLKGTLMASEVETAAELPNLCNDFYSDFLEVNDFFGIPEKERNEIIELIQHLCSWLYKNKYTQNKLSLA